MSLRALSVSCCLAIAAVASACAGDKGATPTAQATMSDSAEQVVFGVQHTLVEGGVKKAALSSDSAFVFENQTRFELRSSVRLSILDSIGTPEATLTAREATYSTVRKSMEARGDVVVTSTDGKRLDTQHLVFDQATNKIRSDSAFVLVEPARRITGTSFISDPKLEAFECPACVIKSLTPIRPDTGSNGRATQPPPSVAKPPVDTLAPMGGQHRRDE